MNPLNRTDNWQTDTAIERIPWTAQFITGQRSITSVRVAKGNSLQLFAPTVRFVVSGQGLPDQFAELAPGFP